VALAVAVAAVAVSTKSQTSVHLRKQSMEQMKKAKQRGKRVGSQVVNGKAYRTRRG
jgi:heme exporter protein D